MTNSPNPAIRESFEEFTTELWNEVDPQAFEAILTGKKPLSDFDIDYKPETFTEEKLVHPLLDAAGLRFGSQAKDRSGDNIKYPDFRITDLATPVVGEAKSIGKIAEATEDLKEYIGPFRNENYGIATDGVVWRLHRAEAQGDSTRFPVISAINISQALLAAAVDLGYLDDAVLSSDVDVRADHATAESVNDAIEDITLAASGSTDAESALSRLPSPRHEPSWGAAGFYSHFARTNFDQRLQRAPQERREKRRRDIEEFYDLYIELLFGEGTTHSFETNLLSSITPPDGSTPESEQRTFALTLVNRLLFIRLLEERDVDAIEYGFLARRVEQYEESQPPLSLYKSEIKPLFTNLLNTPRQNRLPDLRDPDAWYSRVPYLNGGLFRPTVPQEGKYDVENGILKKIILQLIEGEVNGGGSLTTDGTLDPSIIGTVFEKVINHLGAKPDVGLQKEELGAIYTPTDITERITKSTVEPSIKEAITGVILDQVDSSEHRDAVQDYLDGMGLGKILDYFSARKHVVLQQDEFSVEVPFDDSDVVETALDGVTNLRVLDPACGSGHFLTTAMDRLHRAQIKLLTGLNGGDAPPDQERYEAKRKLALTSIFGVDVHKAATEIARLRVWLKVVEGNGWEESYSQLPNIDMNIAHGNALIGFPITGIISRMDVWNDDIESIEKRRLEYKFDSDIDSDDSDTRGEINRLLEREIRPELDNKYISLLSEITLDENLKTSDELHRLIDSIPDGENIYPSIHHIKARPAGGGEFSGEQKSSLQDAGFDVYYTDTTANLDVGDRERTLKTQSDEAAEQLVQDLGALLNGDVVFTQIERQPLSIDLRGIKGKPFHWIAEFPEAVTKTDSGYSLDFDVILGNPPYGDLLNDAEKRLLTPMTTGGGYSELRSGEISGNFIERELHLLSSNGFFGNIVTVGVLSSSERGAEHNLIMDRFESAEISSFARRPSQVFNRSGSRVEINPTIITGRPISSDDDDDESPGEILSSDFLRFSSESRETIIKSHELSPIKGLLLRDRIGGNRGDGFDVFPKVGNDTKHSIIKILSNTPKKIGNWEVDDSQYRVRHRRSFNYWLVATRGNDNLNNMKEYCFPNQVIRDFIYLVANSSLLYSYHMTYGNMQDFGKTRFRRFPVPPQDELTPWKPLIHHYADLLETGLSPYIESKGDIDYRGAENVKELIDEIEFLLGSIYDLDLHQIQYLQKYDCEFARYGPEGYVPVPDNVTQPSGDTNEGAVTESIGYNPETQKTDTEANPF